MKTHKLFTILLFLLFITTLNAQTTYTSVLTGNWDDTNVWSPAGVPGASDVVHIAQGTIVSTNGSREVAGFNTLVGGELLLSGNDGSLTITGNGNWGGTPGGGIIRDATPSNNGVVTIANGAELEIGGNQWPAALYGGAKLLNLGTVRMISSFGIWGQDASVIENQSLFVIDTAGNFGGFPNGGIFINTSTGTFSKASGNSVCNFNANWEFRNIGGTIDIQSGSIVFNCDGTFNGGTYNVASGTILHFDSQNHTFGGTLSGSPAGRIEISAGVTATTETAGVIFDFKGTGLAWSGGDFANSLITIPSDALLILDEFSFSSTLSGGSKLINLGTIKQVENLGFFATDSSIIDNQGVFEIPADNGSLSGNGSPNAGVFLNSGTFHNMGSGTFTVSSGWEFKNLADGVINISSGIFSASNIDNAESSVIMGVGTIDARWSFTNNGINAPGSSTGNLSYISDYNPSSTSKLEIELAGLTPGSEHDQLSINGDANLNGTLDITTINGFIPAVGDSFVVLKTTSNVVDSFTTVVLQNGLYATVNYNSKNVSLVVDSVGTIVAVGDDDNQTIVTEYKLTQNYPNPFNPTTTIEYHIPKAQLVSLVVYNILGEHVTTLVNEIKNAGSYTANFDGTNLTSGIYFYQIRTNDFVEVKKMMMIK